MNIRIEYAPAPIRHIAVQCPKCEKWFPGRDITKDNLQYECDVYYARFECPICGKMFGANMYVDWDNVHIDEVPYPHVYADCLEKKEVWE